MSVNLSPAYRVIIIVVIVGTAFSALAWSGGSSKTVISAVPGQDTMPAHRIQQHERVVKPRQRIEQGRVARELDLRLDMASPEELMAPDPEDLNIDVDLSSLQRLNARIEADVLKYGNLWKTLETLKDMDALHELDRMSIDEQDLQDLKEMNIDEDIWLELQDLKEQMDNLKEELENDADRWVDDYRIHEEVRRMVEAVKMEIPRVRLEVEKAMASYGDGRQWQ